MYVNIEKKIRLQLLSWQVEKPESRLKLLLQAILKKNRVPVMLWEKDVWKTHSISGKIPPLHSEEYRLYEFICHGSDRSELLIEV